MAATSQRTFLGHPVGLFVLFLTEMWERFNYYGMRALLVLYMVNYFRWTTGDATNIYKWYTSLVYLTPILGGFLADRYLGNRLAVIIGGSLLAVGQFFLALDDTSTTFTIALAILVVGNGIFKPNISTQVGRLYPANDPRRDSGYTIFYMGINVGAGLAPLATGWLQENTVGGFHAGFMAAGIGMALSLVIYILGQPLIHEIKSEPAAPGAPAAAANAPMSEEQAARTPPVFAGLNAIAPALMQWLGLLLLVIGVVGTGIDLAQKWGGFTLPATTPDWLKRLIDLNNSFIIASIGFSAWLISYVLKQISGALRDRVLAILLVGIFVVFFWGAFEQAGGSLTIWADKNTNRFLTKEMTPDPFPEDAPPLTVSDEPAAAKLNFWDRLSGMFKLKERKADDRDSLNPMPTAWFQSVNAFFIVALAPVVAWVWYRLETRGLNVSIAFKMVLGLAFVSLSMVAMILAARGENGPVGVRIPRGLPSVFSVNAEGQVLYPPEVKEGEQADPAKGHPAHSGRMYYNGSMILLKMTGALANTERDRLIAATAPKGFVEQITDLRKRSEAAKTDAPVSVLLAATPPGFDLRYAGFRPVGNEWKRDGLTYDPAIQKLTATKPLADKEILALKLAAGNPDFREKVADLYNQSITNRVSPWWLVLSYFLATIGELCLSPVGLSMVSKLAPARFATMLMGLWFLTTFFGNYLAGTFGEVYDTMPPVTFFTLTAAVVGGAALLLLLLVKLITKLMHGVR